MRAMRRHHTARRRQAADNLWHVIWKIEDPRPAGLYENDRRPCSCGVCSDSKREVQGPTLQERKAALQ